jgi:tetratricopeptide (TPR) repeat protein
MNAKAVYMSRVVFFLLILVVILAVSVQAPAGPVAEGPLAAMQQGQPEQPPADATAAQLESEADLLRTRKAYEQALIYFSAALRKSPGNAVLYNKRGMVELQLNDLEAARKDFQRALRKNPRYAEAHNNLGVVYYARRDYKKAIRQYEKALQLRENSASFHSNLGTAWFARHRLDKAMAEYARALQIDPDVLLRSATGGLVAQVLSPEDRAYYSYVLAKIYAGRGDVERCLECLRKAKEDGYRRLDDVYKDEAFAVVRGDPRFMQLMEKAAPE